MPYLGLKGNGLLAGISASAGMGFVLFGYDDGVMGGVLVAPSFLEQFDQPSASLQGTIVSIFIIGCVIGCAFTSIANGRWGRRPLSFCGSAVLSLGAVLQSCSYQVAQLLVGRIVAGIGLGLIVSNIIVWQTECSPSKYRGLLVASSLSFLLVGQVLAYWLEYGTGYITSSASYRFPMAFQAVLGIATGVMLYFMPESPRYLFAKEKRNEAIEIFRLLNTHKGVVDEETVNKTVSELAEAIALESQQAGWKELLRSDNVGSRRRVLLACLINACQAWSGSTPISYFTTLIFEQSVGMSYHTAALVSGILQVWFLTASLGTWWSIEKVGRRVSFMVGCAGMAVIMAILAAMVKVNTHASGIVATLMIFLYQAFYTWSFMGGIWVYGPEIMPLAHRAKGEGLATACLWLSAFVVVEVIPIAIASIGWKVFVMFAVFNLAYIPMVYFLFPETSGLSLEEIDMAFIGGGNPVKKAAELRRRIKRGENVTLDEVFADTDGKKRDVIQLETVGPSKA